MTNTPHELADDFPGMTDRLHQLKMEDSHFARLVAEYHDLNRQVHRAETRIDTLDDLAETDLRKRRAALKDDIARRLAG
jgi:uncharacterized protein YdcH (DUF465 family)